MTAKKTTTALAKAGEAMMCPDDFSSQSDWLAFGEQLNTIDVGIKWVIGDWVSYGVENFDAGLELATGVLDGAEQKTIVQYQRVAERFDTSERWHQLSWSHHRAVSMMPPKQRSTLLERAANQGWSIARMIEEVAEADARAKDVIAAAAGELTRADMAEHKRQMILTWHQTKRTKRNGMITITVPEEIVDMIDAKFPEPEPEPIDVEATPA